MRVEVRVRERERVILLVAEPGLTFCGPSRSEAAWKRRVTFRPVCSLKAARNSRIVSSPLSITILSHCRSRRMGLRVRRMRGPLRLGWTSSRACATVTSRLCCTLHGHLNLLVLPQPNTRLPSYLFLTLTPTLVNSLGQGLTMAISMSSYLPQPNARLPSNLSLALPSNLFLTPTLTLVNSLG